MLEILGAPTHANDLGAIYSGVDALSCSGVTVGRAGCGGVLKVRIPPSSLCLAHLLPSYSHSGFNPHPLGFISPSPLAPSDPQAHPSHSLASASHPHPPKSWSSTYLQGGGTHPPDTTAIAAILWAKPSPNTAPAVGQELPSPLRQLQVSMNLLGSHGEGVDN